MAATSAGVLPAKPYFRIGEVAGLVGVEPHVLRYWEREFRAIRPAKSAKGQRVYSRRDVENLMRVRDLLYREGFTIAGAKKKLGRAGLDQPEAAMAIEPSTNADALPDAPAVDRTAIGEIKASGVAEADHAPALGAKMHEGLLAIRSEIEAFLTELDEPSR
jgi:DNA-binding transcriptional MerR regulator